jgi:hypothetical protein
MQLTFLAGPPRAAHSPNTLGSDGSKSVGSNGIVATKHQRYRKTPEESMSAWCSFPSKICIAVSQGRLICSLLVTLHLFKANSLPWATNAWQNDYS